MPDGTRYGNTPVVPVTGSNEELCAYLDLPAVVQADGLVSVEDVHTCLTLLDQAWSLEYSKESTVLPVPTAQQLQRLVLNLVSHGFRAKKVVYVCSSEESTAPVESPPKRRRGADPSGAGAVSRAPSPGAGSSSSPLSSPSSSGEARKRKRPVSDEPVVVPLRVQLDRLQSFFDEGHISASEHAEQRRVLIVTACAAT
jgi:hypothetical protein